MLSDLAARSTGAVTDGVAPAQGPEALKGKVWVTRRNPFVDRIACGWLIKSKCNRGETDGLEAVLSGLAASEPDDDKRMERGQALIDNLYAFFQRQKPG